MFLKRIDTPEIMDDFSIKDERIEFALNELRLINSYLGGKSTTKAGLDNLFKRFQIKKAKVLDAGAGASDILISLQEKYDMEIIAVEKNIRACKYLRSSQVKVVCCDLNYLPFKKKSFDIIHASLILHHFSSGELKRLFCNFIQIVKKGIIINDLRRNVLALAGINILTHLFSKSLLVKNDAPLSVRRGFIKSEIMRLLNSVKFFDFEIKRKWAFRWLVIIYF
jgi:ubiquinone/menaquinone biosynthesis C-methylase UbiE